MVYSWLEHDQAVYVRRGFSIRLLMVYSRLEHDQAMYVWRGFSIRLLVVYSRLEHAQAVYVQQGSYASGKCQGNIKFPVCIK